MIISVRFLVRPLGSEAMRRNLFGRTTIVAHPVDSPFLFSGIAAQMLGRVR